MLKALRRFTDAREGIAAMEFALIAPLMIVFFYGAVEISSALDCNARVSRVASTVADLVAQSSAVSTTDTTNIFNCAGAILFPYPMSNAKIVVTSITYTNTGSLTVAWSDALNTSKRTSVPSNIKSNMMETDSKGNLVAGSVIYAEVIYTFPSPINYFLGNSATFSSNFYSKPRRSATVTHS